MIRIHPAMTMAALSVKTLFNGAAATETLTMHRTTQGAIGVSQNLTLEMRYPTAS